MKSWLFHSILIAIGYFLAGRLGQFLAVPPSYATAIWPASGIAVAGLLLSGYRMWFGIFVGAFLVNGLTPLSGAENVAEMLSLLPLPLLISSGATAQALTGVYLTERLIGKANTLIYDSDTITFLVCCGPIACIIGSTCGVVSLVQLGFLQQSQVVLNWWTWWIGDVIGVIIFAPLTLIGFAKPREIWHSRWISVSLPLIGAFSAIVLGFITIRLVEQSRVKTRFEDLVAKHIHQLEEQFQQRLGGLYALENYFVSSHRVQQDEFSHYCSRLLKDYPQIATIGWFPLVNHANRAKFVAQAQADGHHHFQILNSEHNYFKSFSLPLYYIATHSNKRIPFGFNLAACTDFKQAIESSIHSRSPTVIRPRSTPALQIQANEMMVLVPVFGQSKKSATTSQTKPTLKGFVLGLLKVSEIVESSLHNRKIDNYNLTISEHQPQADDVIVFQKLENRSPHKESEVINILRHNNKVKADLNIAESHWVCEFTPTPTFYARQANQYTWIILLSSLSLTALFGAFLLLLSGRNIRIRSSEERYLDLYENAPDMFISVDMDNLEVSECNRTFLKTTEFNKPEVINRRIYDLFDDFSQSKVKLAFQRFLKEGVVTDVELSLLTAHQKCIDNFNEYVVTKRWKREFKILPYRVT